MLSTFPPYEQLKAQADKVPPYMRRTMAPYAVVVEGFLSDSECDLITAHGMEIDPYKFHICDAITREFTLGDFALDPITNCVLDINKWYWNYELDTTPAAWLQTYELGNFYEEHMDTAPGQMRKLSAVTFLSEERNYTGGDLVIRAKPFELVVPKTRGTIVVFQPWLMHEVRVVTQGLRQTINMGFWGPPFK